MGYRIAPDTGEWGDQRVRSCPVAEANSAAPLIESYQQIKSGLLTVDQIYPSPSIAVIEALSLIDITERAVINRARERAIEGVNHG